MSQESTAQAATPPQEGLGIYEWCAIAAGGAYLTLPVFIAVPWLFPMVAFVPPLDGNRLGNLASLVAMVTPLALVYFFGVAKRMIVLADLALFWRVFWVLPWLIATWATGHIEATGALFVVGIDIGLSAVAVLFDRRGRGFLGRLLAHFSGFEPSTARVLTLVEVALGFALVTLFSVKSLLSPEAQYVEPFVISLIGCHYFYIAWSAFEKDKDGPVMTVVMRLVLMTALLVARRGGFTNDITSMFAVGAGLFAFIQGYTLLWERMLAAGWSSSRWLVSWSIALAGVTALWALYLPYMTGGGAQLAYNIHRQDLIIGFFALMVGVCLLELEPRAPRATKYLGWLLPFSALWFTTESKMLCHLNVGTPLHPSWQARGLAPLWGGSPLIDVTFGVGTLFMTVISTTSSVAILGWFLPRDGWRLLSFNGLLVILGTAYWMIMASSGIPAFAEQLDALTTLHPPFPVDRIEAVAIHVRDLIMGTAMIAAGIVLSKVLPDMTQPRFLAIGAAWLLFVTPKVLVHYHAFFPVASNP